MKTNVNKRMNILVLWLTDNTPISKFAGVCVCVCVHCTSCIRYNKHIINTLNPNRTQQRQQRHTHANNGQWFFHMRQSLYGSVEHAFVYVTKNIQAKADIQNWLMAGGSDLVNLVFKTTNRANNNTMKWRKKHMHLYYRRHEIEKPTAHTVTNERIDVCCIWCHVNFVFAKYICDKTAAYIQKTFTLHWTRTSIAVDNDSITGVFTSISIIFWFFLFN